MNNYQDSDRSHLQQSLDEISSAVWTVAKQYQGDTHRLLTLLRTLERLHRNIREELFEPSLPNTRNALSNLLREIEEMGGWPYIERMKLQALLKRCAQEEGVETPKPSP